MGEEIMKDKIEEKIIHIEWQDPNDFEFVKNLTGKHDFGIYQIYLDHSIYGREVLSYIGSTSETFGSRMKVHENWLKDSDNGNAKIYTGKLRKKDWYTLYERESKEIVQVEKLLIYSHQPAYNKVYKDIQDDHDIQELHILNWEKRGDLLPEVSGARWTSKFE